MFMRCRFKEIKKGTAVQEIAQARRQQAAAGSSRAAREEAEPVEAGPRSVPATANGAGAQQQQQNELRGMVAKLKRKSALSQEALQEKRQQTSKKTKF